MPLPFPNFVTVRGVLAPSHVKSCGPNKCPNAHKERPHLYKPHVWTARACTSNMENMHVDFGVLIMSCRVCLQRGYCFISSVFDQNDLL